MITENATPAPVDGYRVEEMDGELLLYHPQSTSTIYMNNTAALVWQLCDGTRDVAAIIDILTESFPDSRDGIEDDVKKALETFLNQGALAL